MVRRLYQITLVALQVALFVQIAPPLAQALRDRADGAHVGGHVLAGEAIATGGGLLEQAVAVDDRDRQPVQFRLRDVLQIPAHPEPLVDAPVERGYVLLGEGVVE